MFCAYLCIHFSSILKNRESPPKGVISYLGSMCFKDNYKKRKISIRSYIFMTKVSHTHTEWF